MAKPKMAYKQTLTAPGKADDWIDATEIALDFGTFEKIHLNRKGDTMQAHYGADDISVTVHQKDAQQVILLIECTNPEVLKWYKACVSDVVCHPENYVDYYEGAPKGDASDRKNQYGEADGRKMLQQEKNANVWPILTKTWLMIVMMLIFPPLGLYLYYRFHHATAFKRIAVTLLCIFYLLFIWLGFLGINTGFGLSTITGMFTSVKQSTELKLRDTDDQTPTQTPLQTEDSTEYVGE